MAVNPSVDYTTRDAESIFLDLRSKIPLFLPEWTFQGESDFGIAMLHLWAYLGDQLHFYADRGVNEAMLPTALSRTNVANILKLIDYELRGVTAATVDATFFIDTPLGFPVTIPAGTVIQGTAADGEPVLFETDAVATIAIATVSVDTSATEGETVTGNTLATSTGGATQWYLIDVDNPIPSSLRVFVDEGGGPIEWTEVDSFFLSQPADLHFKTQRDGDERITVFFGDDVRGKIPTATSPITFDVRLGGGTRGNVVAATINSVTSTILAGSPPTPITVRVTNNESAAGGADPETIEEAKEAGPKSLRARNRAVSRDDFDFFVGQVEGVFASRINVPDPTTRRVRVVVVPVGGGAPASTLKTAVEDALELRKMVGTIVEAVNPLYVSLDIQGRVTILPNVRRAVVRTAVLEALADFFSLTNPQSAGFGAELRISNVFDLIDSIPGVDFLNFDRFTIQPTIRESVLTPSSAEFVSIDISATTVPELWTIRVTGPTTFLVEGSVSGVQIAVGTVDEPYTTDGGELTFLLAYPSGSLNRLSPGDFAKIRVSQLRGDVLAASDEFLIEENGGQTIFTFEGGA